MDDIRRLEREAAWEERGGGGYFGEAYIWEGRDYRGSVGAERNRELFLGFCEEQEAVEGASHFKKKSEKKWTYRENGDEGVMEGGHTQSSIMW